MEELKQLNRNMRLLFFVILGEVLIYLVFAIVISFLIFPIRDMSKKNDEILNRLDNCVLKNVEEK
jgi:hypothetical protein